MVIQSQCSSRHPTPEPADTREAILALRVSRQGKRLGDASIRDLIEENRRF
jgi:hypothetical protein